MEISFLFTHFGVAVCLCIYLSALISTAYAVSEKCQVTKGCDMNQTIIDYIADNLDVKVKTVDNLYHDGKKHRVRITLQNKGNMTIPGRDWQIYFYSYFPVESNILNALGEHVDEEYMIKVSHISGSLHKLEPITAFRDIRPGNKRILEFHVKFWAVSVTDYPPNWYVTSPKLEPKVISATKFDFAKSRKHSTRENSSPSFVEEFESARQWKRYRNDEMNPFTPQDRYVKFKLDTTISVRRNIVPTPKSILQEPFAILDFDQGIWNIVVDPGLEEEAKFLSEKLNIAIIFNAPFPDNDIASIRLIVDPALPVGHEGYKLVSSPYNKRVLIAGTTKAGVFYGIQTLLGFIDHDNGRKLRGLDINDEPRYPYRGLYIDIARNFRSKMELKRIIDLMAQYKLNKLHLGLANDEGWRIEIPALPELTQIGSKTCHDLEEKECLLPQLGSRSTILQKNKTEYLTLSDYQSIVRHAAKNNIEIIPEINSPGHAHAAVIAMEARYRKFMATDMVTASLYRLEDPEDLSEYISVQYFKNNVMNPCLDSTYLFIEKIITTLQKAHAEINIPLQTYHFGGIDIPTDAWINSSACNHGNKYKDWKGYFGQRIADMTERLSLNLVGYDDWFIDREGIPYPDTPQSNRDTIVQFYNSIPEFGKSDRAYNLANTGYKVVLSPASHLYLDHPYEPDPEERGLYWASRFSDTQKIFQFNPSHLYENFLTKRSGQKITQEELCGRNSENCPRLTNPDNIMGLEGQLWSENIISKDHLDYMLFPRLLALAERAWHKASWEDIFNDNVKDRERKRDWNKFAHTLGNDELARLDRAGVRYRVTPPGAMVKGGRILTTTEYPGQIIEFSGDRGRKWRPAPENWTLGGGNNEILLRTREGHVQTDADTLGEIMEYSIDEGKTWKLVPKSWPIASYNPILLRTRTSNGKRTSRAVEFDPRGELFIPDQKDVIRIAKDLHVNYRVLNNLIDTNHSYLMSITFTNRGLETIKYGNWSIYLYSIRLLQPQYFPYPNGYLLHDCGLWLHHMGGSLYRLQPDFDKFYLKHKEKVSCLVRGKQWQVARTDVMPNWYIAAEGMKPSIIENTKGDDLDFVGPFNTPNRWKRFPTDQYNPYSPLTRYKVNEETVDYGRPIKKVIPSPLLYRTLEGEIRISPQTWVMQNSLDFPKEANLLAEFFNLSMSDNGAKGRANVIRFAKVTPKVKKRSVRNEDLLRDAYVITMNNGILIEAHDAPGAFYGANTLMSIAEKNGEESILPSMIIDDEPRYSYRGIHLDVARNFRTKAEVMKLLDLMGNYKLNKLHFHLSDDEGWRLEIPGLKELTELGAHRCYDPDGTHCTLPQLGSGPYDTYPGSGFYTVQDYKDILQYAADRHIQIIPEVNTPGHSHAAIKSMELRYARLMKNENIYQAERYLLSEIDENSTFVTQQSFSHNVLNPCLESTYTFIHHVIREVKTMHKDIQPLRTYHLGGPGGDEFSTPVWNASKTCQMFLQADQSNMQVTDLPLYFVQRIGEIGNTEEVDLGLWEDALMTNGKAFDRYFLPTSPRKVYGYAWNNVWDKGQSDNAYKLANAGYKVIIAHATHLFFDHPHEPDPEERGYYWATRFTDTRKVFSYTPDHIIWNADVTTTGIPISHDDVCEKPGCEILNITDNIEGIQGNLWSETMRKTEDLEYMSAPRLLALAERAWHHSEWEDDPDVERRHRGRNQEWYEFANTLGYRELRRLDDMGYNYRVPPPGAIIKGNMLHTNVAFPGLHVEYSTDNKRTWHLVTGPVNIGTSLLIHLRTRSADNHRSSRVIIVTPAVSRSYRPLWRVPFFKEYLRYFQ